MNYIINTFGEIGGPVIFLLVIMYGLVALFLPFIILGIYNRSCRIHQATDNVVEMLTHVPSKEKAEKILAAIESQNTLTRQLLRAYGHEPEA